MDNNLKLFVQAYCSCGTSAYVPIKSETINHLVIDNALRSNGWMKFVYNKTNDVETCWFCKKCTETVCKDK